MADLDKLRARCRSGAFARARSLRRAQFFGRAHFAQSKRKKPLDIQVLNQIGKTVKKLQ